MSKLFLTLITFLGFSFSVLANTIEENTCLEGNTLKKSDLETEHLENSISNLDDFMCRDCFAEASRVEAVLGFWGWDRDEVFNTWYDGCVASGECCGCLSVVIIQG